MYNLVLTFVLCVKCFSKELALTKHLGRSSGKLCLLLSRVQICLLIHGVFHSDI